MLAQVQESLTIAVEVGHDIGADLHVPANATGLVVFAHGSGSSRFSARNRAIAAALNARGFGTLLLDLLTEQEAQIDAEAPSYRFDVPRLASRVVVATDWILRQPSLASLPIGYHGRSATVAVSGTPVVRPCGQLGPPADGVPPFGPTATRCIGWAGL